MMKDEDLDALFAEVRQADTGAGSEADDGFLARVLADAAEVAAARVEPARPAAGPGLLAIVGDMLGGWRGGMALTASALLGVWIGVSDPVGVDTVSGLVGTLSGDIDLAGGETSTLYELMLEG